MKKLLLAISISILLTIYLVGSITYLISDSKIDSFLLTIIIFTICFLVLKFKDFLTERKYLSRTLVLTGAFLTIFIIIYSILALNLFGAYTNKTELDVLFYELLVITATPLVLTLWYTEIQLFNLNYKTITISDQNNKENNATDVTLLSDSQNKELSLDIQDLLVVEAQDNYCKIYYIENNEVKKALFRLSLKKMHEQLSNMNNIIRCHRSYLVNKSKVENILGKSQNYKLKIEGIDKNIPVSRSFDIESVKNA